MEWLGFWIQRGCEQRYRDRLLWSRCSPSRGRLGSSEYGGLSSRDARNDRLGTRASAWAAATGNGVSRVLPLAYLDFLF